MVTGIYPPEIGGPATYLAQNIPRFVEKGFHVDVVTFGADDVIEQKIGVSVHKVARKHFVLSRIVRYIRLVLHEAKTAELIYVHDMNLGLISGYLASRLFRVPYIVRLGGDFLWERAYQKGHTELSYEAFQGNEPFPYNIRRLILTALLKRACAVIVQGEFLKRIVSGWGVKNDRLHVVHNAVEEVEEEDVENKSDLLSKIETLKEDGARVVLASGRFVRGKHYDLAIRALLGTKDVHLVLMGDGPEEGRYREIIEKESLKEKVTLIGGKERAYARALLAASDCYVLPSETDTFSFMTLEALLLDTPVLLYKTGALKELFSEYEGEGVSYFEVLTAAALSAKLNNGDTYQKPTEETKRALRARFAITTHFEAVHAIVLECLGSGK